MSKKNKKVKRAKRKKSLTKNQFIDLILTDVNETNEDLTKKDIKSFLDSMVNVIYANADKGVPIPGLGKLVVVDRKARKKRKGRNPATGEEIMIAAKPASKALKFRISKIAKESIL